MASAKNKVGMLEGVFVYAKIAEADKKYQSEDTEWSIQVLVDKATAKQWKKDFPKQEAKVIDIEDFEAKFRMEVPEEFDGQDEVYAITLRRAEVHNGVKTEEKHRPRVFLVPEGSDEKLDITESRLIANGSRGKVSYYISDSKYGPIARLKNVLMQEEDFKEYVSAGGGAAGSEFDGAPAKVTKEAPKESATQARAQRAAKKPAKAAEAENDTESDDPF